MVSEAALVLIAVLRFAVLVQHGIERLAFALCHRVLKLTHLLFKGDQPLKDAQCGIDHGCRATKVDVLGENTDAKSADTLKRPLVGTLKSHYQTENGCLAGAISAHKANVFTGIDLKIYGAQNILRAVGFMNISEAKKHYR